MSSIETNRARTALGWIGPVGIFLAHAIALGLFFMVLAFIVPSFAHLYLLEGMPRTPQFNRVLFASDYVTIYWVIPFFVIAIDAIIVALIARTTRRWLSTYSHLLLAFIAIATFVSFGWTMHPLDLNIAGKINAKNSMSTSLETLTADINR